MAIDAARLSLSASHTKLRRKGSDVSNPTSLPEQAGRPVAARSPLVLPLPDFRRDRLGREMRRGPVVIPRPFTPGYVRFVLQPLESRTVQELDLAAALDAEAVATNNILPAQPGLHELSTTQRTRFAEWLAMELQSGLMVAPRYVVNARKAHHGTRPAPVLAIQDRVAYRAIVNKVLESHPDPARSREDYLRFLRGPVDYVAAKTSGLRVLRLFLDDDEIQYVVTSDVAAFYEYIDHGILARLLLTRVQNIDLAQALGNFLGELEGRGFGLPQMFEPSDRLSEVYAQALQDQLARRGLLVWRFNDDFRIGVPSFEAALDAIEALAEEARSLGLIINEQKTLTPKFAGYAITTFGLSGVEDEIPAEEEDEVEAAVAEYTEMFGDPDDAVQLLVTAVSGDSDDWDLTELTRDDVARLRRSLWTVVRASDPRALPAVVPLSIYAPSLTPVLCRYAEALSPGHPAEVARTIDTVIANVSLGAWQRMWFLRLLREARLLHEQAAGDRTGRIAFAESALQETRHRATRAEAFLALAPVGAVSAESAAASLVTEPASLASWYVLAAAEATRTERDERILRGIRGAHPVYRMLLDAIQ